MSMLSRYQKPGGLIQLINLIETCVEPKKTQLLKIIEKENPAWARLLYQKSLTVDKIFSWSQDCVAEIITHMPDKIIAVLLHNLPEERKAKVIFSMARAKTLMIEEIRSGHTPSAGEVSAAHLKLILKVRELEKSGNLKLDQIDPTCSLSDVKAA